MNSKKFIRKEALPLGWCPGCGLHTLFAATCQVLDQLNLTRAIVVSGIGCTGRGAGYFNLETVHGLHGRAIPTAVGIKKANPRLKVIVFSGDGDLLGIGGNHLLHAARRNDPLTVICNANEVFGMTGGQAAPTTRLGSVTTTTPQGNPIPPINSQGILLANQKYFYARTSPVFPQHLARCLSRALKHQGFSFIEVLSPCLVNYARKMGKTAQAVFEEIKTGYQIRPGSGPKPLKENELGITQNQK